LRQELSFAEAVTAHQQSSGTDQSKLEARINDYKQPMPQLSRRRFADRITGSGNEAPRKRRAQAGRFANTAASWSATGAEQTAQSELRQELEKAQKKQLQDQHRVQALTERARITDQEYQTAKSDVEQQVKKLTESLAQESQHRKAPNNARRYEKRRSGVGSTIGSAAARA